MDAHPLSARAVVALALLGGCGDNLVPEVPPATVEVAAIPGISTKHIDVAIVAATADPARLAAALPALLTPVSASAGGAAFAFAVFGADGALASPLVYAGTGDYTAISAAVAAVPPATGGELLHWMRSGLAVPGFRRNDAEVVELIAADSDDASPDDVAEVATALGATDARFAAVVVADPLSPRWSAFAAAFGAHGVIVPPAADLAASLGAAAPAVQQVTGRACLDATALLDAGLEGGIQPLCSAIELRAGSNSDLPECPHEGDCFAVVHDDYACPHVPDYLRVSVNFVTAPTATTSARVRCELP